MNSICIIQTSITTTQSHNSFFIGLALISCFVVIKISRGSWHAYGKSLTIYDGKYLTAASLSMQLFVLLFVCVDSMAFIKMPGAWLNDFLGNEFLFLLILGIQCYWQGTFKFFHYIWTLAWIYLVTVSCLVCGFLEEFSSFFTVLTCNFKTSLCSSRRNSQFNRFSAKRKSIFLIQLQWWAFFAFTFLHLGNWF